MMLTNTSLTFTPSFAVDRETRARLEEAAAPGRVGPFNPYGTSRCIEEFVSYSRREVAAALDLGILTAVNRFKLDPCAPGVLLVRGLPVMLAGEELAPTPADGGRPTAKSLLSELVVVGVGSLLGEPFAMTTEKRGDLVHTIAPVKGRESRQANDGSRRFSSHIEHAFREERERLDTLLLLCIRPDHDHQAVTTFTEIRDVLPHLSWSTREIIREPLFSVRSPQSVGDVAYSEPRPILCGPDEDPRVCFNLAGMTAVRSYAQPALDELAEAVESPEFQRGLKLDRGDLLIINNRRVSHGRSDFTPRYDGFDRFLQRIFVKPDLSGYRCKLVQGSLRLFH